MGTTLSQLSGNAMLQLKILADTILKLRPIQASQLPDEEEQPILAGTVLNLHSYADIGDHLRVALAGQTFKGRNTWYVFERHAQVLKDGKVITFSGVQLQILVNTFLKSRPIQSSQLKDEEKELVRGGDYFNLSAYSFERDHLKITLADRTLDNRNTWFVFKDHARILREGKPVTPPSKKLSEDDYQKAAASLGVPVATIKAVVAVETSGGGFLSDGRPKILFEAHWFSDYTSGRYDISHPDISSRRWNPSLYRGGAAEYPRLQRAMALNRAAALQSASWGLGQIMGGNYQMAGYSNVENFVKDMYESEGKQLMAMVNFIKSQGLADDLRQRNWAGFALGYNGEGYRANNYDVKLAQAYAQFS
ncbi:MAG: N-acetylmuramidase family protein [Leptolyngbyaceae cyanobacterium bins.59]|nr:N-acetylmuramidase family protein [Leptolyngbyaceae cyanobacterium bins.59]